MKTSFHNTIEATGTDLKTFEAKAQSQEEKILEFFRKKHNKECSPFHILYVVFNHSIPLTSVRRGMSNLTSQGLLVKTENQQIGKYGRPEYKWRLAERAEQTKLFS